MIHEGLVFGLLDTSPKIPDPVVADKCRGFTISWSRYDYQGPILEGRTVDEILDAALERGYRCCFIQSCGNIICERWTLQDWQSRDFCASLAKWIEEHDFLVAGPIVADPDAWYGLDPRYLLVDLAKYAQLGKPRFESPSNAEVPLPRPEPRSQPQPQKGSVPDGTSGRIAALVPSGATEIGTPQTPGWRFVAESLNAGLEVTELGAEILGHMLWLEPDCPSQGASLAGYLNQGIEQYREDASKDALSSDQCEFLDIIARQAEHARRGVFLFNIESYSDVETPPTEFQPPVSSLYSVAAGFKPNRILQTHRFDEHTRVVYFDYSPNALEIKKCIVDQWDGEDFPGFMRFLFRTFPYPQTFYHLWGDISPDEVDWSDVEDVWQKELTRWGGAAEWAEYWQAYRRLPHEYVCCDIIADPTALIDRVRPEASAILWWSNAFFTMYGNWFHSLDVRETRYRDWIARLAAKNPELFLYGSDCNNTNVNFVQAGDYWDQYRRLGVSCLEPCTLYQRKVRM